MADTSKVNILNINHPGSVRLGDRKKYEAMRRAVLSVVPPQPPGITITELEESVLPLLPEAHFPGGATAGWWTKTVQLDLEARGAIVRGKGRPLRLLQSKNGIKHGRVC